MGEVTARDTVSADELREIVRRRGVRLTVADVAAATRMSEEDVRADLSELRGRPETPVPESRSSFDAAQARAEAWQARQAADGEAPPNPARRSRWGCGSAVLLGLFAAVAIGWPG